MLSFLLEDQLQMWVIEDNRTYDQKPRWTYGWTVEILSFTSSLLSALFKAITYFVAQYKVAKKLEPGRKRQRIMCKTYFELSYVFVYISLTLAVLVNPESIYTEHERYLDILVLISLLYFFLWVPFYFCIVTVPRFVIKCFGRRCCCYCKRYRKGVSDLNSKYMQYDYVCCCWFVKPFQMADMPITWFSSKTNKLVPIKTRTLYRLQDKRGCCLLGYCFRLPKSRDTRVNDHKLKYYAKIS